MVLGVQSRACSDNEPSPTELLLLRIVETSVKLKPKNK